MICKMQVDWRDETECFQGFAQQLALLYQVHPNMYLSTTSSSSSTKEKDSPTLSWILEFVLFPAMRSSFSPPAWLAQSKAVVQIAACEELYRIFERC
jgi:hypothetical protein